MTEQLYNYIHTLTPALNDMADAIFDRPELGFQEVFAVGLVTDYLKEQGFAVECGYASLDTAFRAEYIVGDGSGASIGLLCEYDALAGMGHACGHHMQAPAILAAAVALKDNLTPEHNCKIIVYGTPAEEGGGGKMTMIEHGAFQDIDVALMMHGSPVTCVDVKSLALIEAKVTYHGVATHAALSPEKGKSAFDALLLAFQGIEFLREHVFEDTRMHYTMTQLPGPSNVVPATAVGSFTMRSYNSVYLGYVKERFEKIIQGAALMADVDYEIQYGRSIQSRIPARTLGSVVMKHAQAVGAPRCRAPREKTGSTDFGNVCQLMPGIAIRMAFVPEGSSSHSQEYIDNGKTQAAYDAIAYSGQILAATAYDLITNPQLMAEIQEEFRTNKEQLSKI